MSKVLHALRVLVWVLYGGKDLLLFAWGTVLLLLVFLAATTERGRRWSE